MALEMTRISALFDKPSRVAQILQPLGDGERLRFAGQSIKVDNEVWLKVTYTPPAGSKIPGFVLEDHCKQVADVRPELKVDGFIRNCIMQERIFNLLPTTEPWFVAADFVIARGIIETGLTNVGPKIEDSDAVGPLQVSSDEWAAFLKDGGEFAKEFEAADSSSDRDDAQLQISAAIFRMHADAKAFSELKAKDGVDPAERDFLPSYLDLFHAHLLDSPKAAFAIDKAQGSDASMGKSMEDLLKSVLTQEEVNALFKARDEYLGKIGSSKTVEQFFEIIEQKLEDALDRAFLLIKQHAPDELPTEPSDPNVVVKPIDTKNVAQVPDGNPVDFAAFGASATKRYWPIITDDKRALIVSYQDTSGNHVGRPSRRFLARRGGGARHHVGVDLFCRKNDVVVACADGTVVAFHHFYKGTWALLIEHDGVVINYGEVKRSSRSEFGWGVGHKVKAGDRIARVGHLNMIHFETYVPGTNKTSSWLVNNAKPPNLRNPTVLLLNLAATGARIDVHGNETVGVGGSGHEVSGDGEPPSNMNDDDLLTLARTIFGEARSANEPSAGREAVAHVVMNRVKRKHRGNTISEVCLAPKQFSCWNHNDPNRKVIENAQPNSNKVFDECYKIAARVMKGLVADNTGGATHYYNFKTIGPPFWTAPPATKTKDIGSHRFYKNVA